MDTKKSLYLRIVQAPFVSFEAHYVRTSGCAAVPYTITATLFVVPGRRSLGEVGRARRASRTITEPIIALVRAIRHPSRRSLCSPSGRTDLANSIGSREALVLNSRTGVV